jgi:2-keto-3-deoxy-L-rhamnonate aldolase RhmA
MLADPLEYLDHANRETLLILQVEDREAVECVEKIAAVEGVDLLLIGPADLTLSYGVPMQLEHPEVQKAIDRVASAVAKAGKWWGIATATPQAAQRALDRGARMITCGSDHVFLVRGFQDAYVQFKDLSIP